ncbi:MAG TPA: polysaccharide deacetylase [Gammaproteobacteria bacterium]|nr:polysaccharide deacetylase [Gammaproteobacteria bacterium]
MDGHRQMRYRLNRVRLNRFWQYGALGKRLMVALLLCLGLNTPVVAEEAQAVVLMYHHFGVDQYPSTNVRLEQFDAHLAYIEEAGFAVWPLHKVVDYVRTKRVFPGKVVAITIDDAYRSVYTEAYPRLRSRGWPFTVFVASDGVDNHFKAYMDWNELREMIRHGARIENHSASHDYLIRRRAGESGASWRARMVADIDRAQRRITEELGVSPSLFAYPYGEYDVALAKIVRERGLVAFGQQSGPVGLDADLRALPRFPMAERFAALADFKQKLNSLAFPIVEVQPWNPVVARGSAPRMTVVLGESQARLDQLSCFVSGQGAVAVTWLNREQRHFAVQAPAPLPRGRSRYNCTAPSLQTGRYFWFSHLWIVQD